MAWGGSLLPFMITRNDQWQNRPLVYLPGPIASNGTWPAYGDTCLFQMMLSVSNDVKRKVL
jgi:hypothetical protein